MAYQVLARKWRPQGFDSLVGQAPIVTALSNALTEGRIAQAYLFSGIRGVGKTTTARLLAKALNCERGPTAEPCNECQSCREITRGSNLDVIEVDAATYSKVEQVRELTESLRYGAARDRYKVVVIDEIHRLSRQAFDALLKIVEEPPPHLVFIFATTELEAVPATILSRCQEFRFRRVATEELAGHLSAIAEAEEIEAGPAALRLIARAGEGSVRDAVALLDQLATFGSGTISDEDAARLAGRLDAPLLIDLLRAILAGDGAGVRAIVERVESEGWDPRHVYAQFLGLGRDALHLALGDEPSRVDLPADDAVALAALAVPAGYENLLRLLQLLLAGEETVRRSEAGVLAVEIAWLRAAELPKLTRVEELLAGSGGEATGTGRGTGVAPSSSAAAPTASGSAPAPGRTRQAAPRKRRGTDKPASAPEAEPPATTTAEPARTAKAAATAEPVAAEPARTAKAAAATAPKPTPTEPTPAATEPTRAASADAPAAASGDAGKKAPARGSEEPAARLERLIDAVSRHRAPLGALLGDLATARALRVEDAELLVYSPLGDPADQALKRAGNRRALERALATEWGDGARWRVINEVSPETPQTEPEAEGETPAAEVAQHPTVQAVLDIFDGTLEATDPD